MRLVLEKDGVRRAVKWARRAAFACGVLLLGYWSVATLEAWAFQWRENLDLDRLMAQQRTAGANAPQSESSAVPRPQLTTSKDGLIGRIALPRLHITAVVMEGIDRTTLRHAVGHIPGTALPGEPGNIGLAGHRDTFFRALKDVRVTDEIEFATLNGAFKYQVESLSIVDPSDVSVLARSDENLLTLVACYPFYFVGPAPKRWIVRARQVVP